MTKIGFQGNGILCLDAISKEEDLNPKCRFIISRPPRDGRCEVCGRHMSELAPFGGPGDPGEDDFAGELLVITSRPSIPYNEEAEKALKEVDETLKAESESADCLPWLIDKYGEKRGKDFYFYGSAYSIGTSWECRDCIVLDEDEYFKTLRKRNHSKRDV